MNKSWLLCVSEPSCAVRLFDCVSPPPLLLWGFVILWHAKTLILESVKLLKCESIHGRRPTYLPSVFALLVFAFMVQTVFLPTLAFFSGVCFRYFFTTLKQCQWRSAVVTHYILSACPLMFTWTWSWCVFDLIPCSCCSENAWHEHLLLNGGFFSSCTGSAQMPCFAV